MAGDAHAKGHTPGDLPQWLKIAIIVVVLIAVGWFILGAIADRIRGPYSGDSEIRALRQQVESLERQLGRGGGSSSGGSTTVPNSRDAFTRSTRSTTRQCVPCVDGYSQNPAICECTRVRWVPGY